MICKLKKHTEKMNRKVFFYLAILIGFSAILYFIILIKFTHSFSNSEIRVKELEIEISSHTLYLKSVSNSGLVGSFDRIYLSKRPNLKFENHNEAYQFYDQGVFYKVDHDSLIIYLLKPYKSPIKQLNVNLRIQRINNYPDFLYMKQNLSKLKLSSFNTCE